MVHPGKDASSRELQTRNAAVRAAAGVRALTGAHASQAAEAAAAGSERTSALGGDHAPDDMDQPSEFSDGIQPGLEAGTAANSATESQQPVAMDIETGPNKSPGTPSVPAQSLGLPPKPSAAGKAPSPADARTAGGAGPAGTAVEDVEPAPLVDGRPPERSWLTLRGTGAGRVDLYRVTRKL